MSGGGSTTERNVPAVASRDVPHRRKDSRNSAGLCRFQAVEYLNLMRLYADWVTCGEPSVLYRSCKRSPQEASRPPREHMASK